LARESAAALAAAPLLAELDRLHAQAPPTAHDAAALRERRI
jgi:hypothetical protein